MGRLILESITVEGFGSYRSQQTLRLDGQGVTAIVGPNGAGKSTIASKALTWGLYGKCAPERSGASTGALKGGAIVADTCDRARVAVWLRDRERGLVYRITRQRRKQGGEQLDVCGGDDAADMHPLGTEQATIDQLIGADYDVFTRTCVRGQADPWSFAEATDARKREILDVISGAVTLTVPFERAKRLVQAREVRCGEAQRRLADVVRQLSTNGVVHLAAQEETWAQQAADKLQAAQQQVGMLRAELATGQAVEADRQRVTAQRAEIAARVPALDLQPYRDAELAAGRAHEAACLRLFAARTQQAEAQSLIAGGFCPTCQQPITPGAPLHAVAAAPAAALLEDERAAHLWCQAALAARQGAEQWLADQRAAHQAELDALPVVDRPAVQQIAASVAIAEQRLTDLAAASNPWTVAREQAAVQRAQLEAEQVAHQADLAEAEQELQWASAWAATLSPRGVRAQMADAALSAIEVQANYWLSALSEGRMSIAFPATRTTGAGSTKEEIQAIVKMGGTERPLLAFSGGEKRRINLAVDLGVAAVFARGGALALSVLVLDEECSSGMDAAGKAAMAQALSAAGVADIVVVDHDPALHGALPRTVRVEASAQGSRLVEV